MSHFNGEFLSRRNWLGVGPAAAGLAAAHAQAQPAADKNLGAKIYNIRDFGAPQIGVSRVKTPRAQSTRKNVPYAVSAL